MTDDNKARSAVQRLYNTYPFPPEPLLDQPPPGYNWRWHWQAVYNFCCGRKPSKPNIRILDAGCGTGVGTEYLMMLNREAHIVAIDISEKALDIARERCQRSGVATARQGSIEFLHLPLEEAHHIRGEFDLINCVGVLHHLPNPVKGIQALTQKLAHGGLFHIFVYGELGRWEIQLMQKAIAILQGDKRGNYKDGVSVGRKLFASLPEDNRLVKREKQRWSLENHRDESFADMYVHPQEVDYNIDTLFDLINASGLAFVNFSNPSFWQLERLLDKAPDLLARARTLGDRERYRLIELLDPEVTHYEFFLGKPPLVKTDWSDDGTLLKAIPEVHPCIHGWPSRGLLDYDYRPVDLTADEFAFMEKCDGDRSVGEILSAVKLSPADVRSLQSRQLIMLH